MKSTRRGLLGMFPGAAVFGMGNVTAQATQCEEFDIPGWDVVCSGWKTDQGSDRLCLQWMALKHGATETEGPIVISSYPGFVGVHFPGHRFNTARGDSQKDVTARTPKDVRDQCRVHAFENLKYVIKTTDWDGFQDASFFDRDKWIENHHKT